MSFRPFKDKKIEYSEFDVFFSEIAACKYVSKPRLRGEISKQSKQLTILQYALIFISCQYSQGRVDWSK